MPKRSYRTEKPFTAHIGRSVDGSAPSMYPLSNLMEGIKRACAADPSLAYYRAAVQKLAAEQPQVWELQGRSVIDGMVAVRVHQYLLNNPKANDTEIQQLVRQSREELGELSQQAQAGEEAGQQFAYELWQARDYANNNGLSTAANSLSGEVAHGDIPTVDSSPLGRGLSGGSSAVSLIPHAAAAVPTIFAELGSVGDEINRQRGLLPGSARGSAAGTARGVYDNMAEAAVEEARMQAYTQVEELSTNNPEYVQQHGITPDDRRRFERRAERAANDFATHAGNALSDMSRNFERMGLEERGAVADQATKLLQTTTNSLYRTGMSYTPGLTALLESGFSMYENLNRFDLRGQHSHPGLREFSLALADVSTTAGASYVANRTVFNNFYANMANSGDPLMQRAAQGLRNTVRNPWAAARTAARVGTRATGLGLAAEAAIEASRAYVNEAMLNFFAPEAADTERSNRFAGQVGAGLRRASDDDFIRAQAALEGGDEEGFLEIMRQYVRHPGWVSQLTQGGADAWGDWRHGARETGEGDWAMTRDQRLVEAAIPIFEQHRQYREFRAAMPIANQLQQSGMGEERAQMLAMQTARTGRQNRVAFERFASEYEKEGGTRQEAATEFFRPFTEQVAQMTGSDFFDPENAEHVSLFSSLLQQGALSYDDTGAAHLDFNPASVRRAASVGAYDESTAEFFDANSLGPEGSHIGREARQQHALRANQARRRAFEVSVEEASRARQAEIERQTQERRQADEQRRAALGFGGDGWDPATVEQQPVDREDDPQLWHAQQIAQQIQESQERSEQLSQKIRGQEERQAQLPQWQQDRMAEQQRRREDDDYVPDGAPEGWAQMDHRQRREHLLQQRQQLQARHEAGRQQTNLAIQQSQQDLEQGRAFRQQQQKRHQQLASTPIGGSRLNVAQNFGGSTSVPDTGGRG